MRGSKVGARGPFSSKYCLLLGPIHGTLRFERAGIEGLPADSPVHHEAWDWEGFLVQRFHVETGTFHLSWKEYVVLPLDWTTILGI